MFHHLSGSAYKAIATLLKFKLPSKSSMSRWLQGYNLSSGLNKEGFAALKVKVNSMKESDRRCMLGIDEMSLKRHIFYDVKSDKIQGIEDFGNNNRSSQVASSVLVLMAHGINRNWKPISFYFSNNSCPSEKLQVILKEAIVHLQQLGLEVQSVVSDMGSNSIKLAKESGVTANQPFFKVKDQKLFYIFDPPHLIKSIRNNFIKYDIAFNNEGQNYTAK